MFCKSNPILTYLISLHLYIVGFQEDPYCLLQSCHPVMYQIVFNMAWFTVMAIILVFLSTWPRPKADEFAAMSYGWFFCNQWYVWMKSVFADFLKYGLVHRDGHNHSSKYPIVDCSLNLIQSNLPALVHHRLPRRALLFASVLPSRHVSELIKYGLVHRDGNKLGIHVCLTTAQGWWIRCDEIWLGPL